MSLVKPQTCRRLQGCLLGAVSSAKNPFIPGMNLSVAFALAARRAVEGEKRVLHAIQVGLYLPAVAGLAAGFNSGRKPEID